MLPAAWQISLPLIAGLFLWLSFFAPILIWIALVPIALTIRAGGDRRLTYLGAWLGGLVHFLPGTYWLCYCADWVWIGWLLLSAYLAIYFPAFVFIGRVCHRRWNLPLVLVIPLTWVSLEYIRSYALTGFSWLLLAHSVYENIVILQIADLAGVWGVSFLIAMVNAGFVELLSSPLVLPTPAGPRLNRSLIGHLVAVGFAVVAALAYGYQRTSSAGFTDGPTCVILQTNVPQDMRNDQDQAPQTFRRIWSILAPAKEIPADLVIWPETSYPYSYGWFADNITDEEIAREYLERSTAPGRPLREKPTAELGEIIRANFKDGDDHTQKIARALGKPLLVGTSYWHIELAGARLTNASVLVTPEEGRVGIYEKIHILPFGEFIPLGGWIPFLAYLLPYPPEYNYDSDAGREPVSLHHDNIHVAPLICFEDALPHLSRAYVRQATSEKPVDILVNQSNDGWFNNSIEGSYHLAASVFRCVETRRPMIRCSNTGPSGLVDGNGRVVQTFTRDGKTQGVDGLFTVRVPLDGRSTLYVSLGDWLPGVGIAVASVCLLLSLLRQISRIRRGSERSG
jgi:apolipoprotein N-acyltransferase